MAMCECRILAITTFLLWLGFVALIEIRTESPTENTINHVCLGCLCEAVSGCNRTAGCQSGACGPFHITYPYWVESGNATWNGESPESEEVRTAFETCACNVHCASLTVENYMRKFGRDCNSNNEINCLDYAAIHRLGPYGCTGILDYEFDLALVNCLRIFSPKKNV